MQYVLDKQRNNPYIKPVFSFIVPTRGQTARLQRHLDSYKETAHDLSSIEVILVVDDDDTDSKSFSYDGGVLIKKIVVKPGLNMGVLNMAGYEVCSGDYIMLSNDDVILRTKDWDKKILDIFSCFPDRIVLVHTNDLLFKEKLCTFPFVPRTYCEIAGGICPKDYVRYRIDDHIYNVFNMLGVLGRRRIVYLPDIVFEHDHYVYNKARKKEYKPNEKILAIDDKRFNELLAVRKQLTVKLMTHIDAFAEKEKSETRHKVLSLLSESFSIRRPEFVRCYKESSPQKSKDTRVTVGVVCASIHNKHTKTCIRLLKKYTANFDLIVLDNNYGLGFNHSREMNKILSFVNTDYLVLMDDDVFVQKGWLDGLLSLMKPDVGVVTPLHKNSDGEFSYGGIVFCPKWDGHHSHITLRPEKPQPIVSLCSAVLMVDMSKCGHIRFDEGYSKYFLDIDYGLRIWEAGFKVVCASGTIVTHIGGGTLVQGSNISSQLFEEQRQYFVDRWIVSGRLDRLKNDVWRVVPEFSGMLGLPERFEFLLATAYDEKEISFNEKVKEFFNETEPYLAIRNFFMERLIRTIETLDKSGESAPFYKERLVSMLGHCGFSTPILLDSYKCYNLVGYQSRIYGAPLWLGMLNISDEKTRQNSAILSGFTIDEVKKRIDNTELGRITECLKKMLPSRLVSSLTTINSFFYFMRVAKHFYKKFPNFVRSRSDGPLKLLLTLVRPRFQFLFQHEKTSLELLLPQTREGIENQLKTENENREIFPSYRVETIINTCFNEENVFPNIDYETYQMLCNNKQHRQKALFIGRELPLNFKEAFEQLHYDLTFLIPKSEKEDWIKFLPNSYQSHQEIFNLASPSPEQIQKIKDHNFDTYIISYGTRINWGDVTIEQYIGNFTHSFTLINPIGDIRIYDKWDDLMRINYNKSLLGTMFKYIPSLKDKKILDIGCSDGMVEDLLLCEDPKMIVGIDIMDGVGCNYKNTKIAYYKMDAGVLDFEENSFDLCFSFAVLEHCNDPFLVLQKIKRVIKRGGYCFIQSAPMYFSPFGHHMFGYFDNYPWIHLLLSKDEIIDYCKRNNIEVKSERSSNPRIEDYIHGMLNDDHINGKLFKEYRIEEFISQTDIEVLYYSRSYEGENLLTKEIINKLKHYPEEDLISHGFELVFKVK